MAAMSSFMTNNHFRRKLKLGNFGRMSSYLTVVATPTMISALFHSTVSCQRSWRFNLYNFSTSFQFIQSHIILQKFECPLCIQTRAAVIQGLSGVAYPFLLAPLAAFFFATRHFTYRLPSITAQPKENFKLWFKFTKSAGNKALFLLGLNMFVGMLVTAKEMSEHNDINRQLHEYEMKFDSGSLPEQQIQPEELGQM